MISLVLSMRLRRISIRRYRATLLQGSTHVGPNQQIYANLQHKILNSIALLLQMATLVRLVQQIDVWPQHKFLDLVVFLQMEGLYVYFAK